MIRLSKRADLVFSALIYVLGTGSLFAVDLFLSKILESNPELMADWAFFRAIVFLGSSLTLLGCEQAVIRAPMRASRLVPPMAVQVVLLAMPLLCLPAFTPMAFSGLTLFLAAASLAIVMGVCGHFRSHLMVTASQICANGWKILFGTLVVVMWWQQLDWSAIAVLMTGCLLAFAAVSVVIGLASGSVTDFAHESEIQYTSLLPIGSRFWLFAIVANCVTYLDQILLSLDGQKIDASIFFSYRALFLPAVLFAIGYLGIIVAPYIRKNPDAFRASVARWLTLYLGLGVLVITLALASGLGMGKILGKFENGLDWSLIGAFLVIGTLRYAYIMPSALMSVYATKRELDRMLLVSLVGVTAMVLTYFGMRYFDCRPIWSVIVGSLVHSVFRIGYGMWLSIFILRSDRPVGALS